MRLADAPPLIETSHLPVPISRSTIWKTTSPFVAYKGNDRVKHPISIIRGSLSLRFAVFIAIYCLAPGFMRSYTSALPFATTVGVGEAMFSGVAVVLMTLAVASIVLFGETKIDLAYKFVVPLMAAGLLLLPFLSAGQET